MSRQYGLLGMSKLLKKHNWELDALRPNSHCLLEAPVTGTSPLNAVSFSFLIHNHG